MKNKTVYLDNCTYNRPFDDQSHLRISLETQANYSIVENRDILIKANEIMQKNIKPLDALHLACAINTKIDYFITVDDGILKYDTNEIRIFDPIMFIKYWEGQEKKKEAMMIYSQENIQKKPR
jgi:predicted nucleic acid-binding protein